MQGKLLQEAITSFLILFKDAVDIVIITPYRSLFQHLLAQHKHARHHVYFRCAFFCIVRTEKPHPVFWFQVTVRSCLQGLVSTKYSEVMAELNL